jgi:GNAT superfamily N-acetyltransferase
MSLQEHLIRSNPALWRLSPKRASELTDIYRKMITNERIRLLVVYDTETKTNVGMAFGCKLIHEEFVPNQSGKIDDMWIDPDHRRKGLCTGLLSHLVEYFAAAGINSLTLDYVDGNYLAEQTWPRFGFQSVLKTANATLSEVENRSRRSEW